MTVPIEATEKKIVLSIGHSTATIKEKLQNLKKSICEGAQLFEKR